MLALSDSENDLNTLVVVSLVMFVPWLFIAFALWCLLWDEVLWPRITCHKIVEVEHLDDELEIEVEEIVKFNEFINRESNIKRPTVEDINNEKPRVVLRTRVSGSEELKESTFEFDKRHGNWWPRDWGWDGDPAGLKKNCRTTVHIVPSDRDHSYITAELRHSRFCPRRHFRNDGNRHRHGGRCRLISSEEHVTWHIKGGQ